ncbi:ribosome biogenesis GTPase [Thermosyntropha lipolytica DSM 11003]|uniref:Small ribosomal subunit biogenesis GTPase RsgA n=1 Tax=Thermosyntropha lipolytica DSM 11003 TaxID=1123382 RepID=A0A1M5QZC3_9FIRM|nr:ribosome small subunit-dependent GTPase A [Thermosyntropha lipolytica]SHH19281.1 ribosome biogenesis GTPase [Thermosyntropha lipolytica DSM 11003]
MKNSQAEGVVLKKYSGFYYVKQEEKIYECKLRGKLKDPVLSGDKVIISVLSDDKGVIEKILPRKNELLRPRIANVSMVLIVMCNDKPAPSLSLLDRLLVLAYYNHLVPYIILNKIDMAPDPKAMLIKDYYPHAGFNFLETSALQGKGIKELREIIKGEIAVFAGPSGAGKSSLLNALTDGSLKVKTQEVSTKIGRGKHTTRHVELYPLEEGGFIADTPGFSVLDMPAISRNELAKYFPDFSDFAPGCRFNNCLHWKEKECAVIEAVKQGTIAEFRYYNYLDMLQEVIENERCY